MAPSAPYPENEAERLIYLHALGLLDTPPEERFDRITLLAKKRFHVPIALISLVDAQRQWFKSRQGLEACETSRDVSFCAHALLKDEPLIVRDATLDPRFFDNPSVTGAPYIRFYVGVPIKGLHGHTLGTLCIADTEPRILSETEIERMKELADLVQHEINRVVLHQDSAVKF